MLDAVNQENSQSPPRTRVLAADYYINQDVLNKEKKQLFFDSWQYACHTKDIPSPGDYTTLTLFDQKIFLIKTNENEINAYFNVCPHRGHVLVEGQGQKRVITCPYHSWTYSLEGKLIGARGINAISSVEKSNICLFSVRVDQVLDFVFINLNPQAQPLNEFAPGLADQILTRCPDVLSYQPTNDASEGFHNDYLCESNWKVMIDNYLECYHCESAHRTFKDMMDIPSSKFDLHQNYTSQVAPSAMKEDNKAFPLNLEHDITVGNFWFLFPNTTLGQFPGVPGFYISRFDPLTPDCTNRVTTSLVPPKMPDDDATRRDKLRAQWNVNVVSAEDKALCENVQRGMHQLAFKEGWYITDPESHNISEHAMRYFHDLYLEAMSN